MNCPIINNLKSQGGTLYSFSSVNRDINSALSESEFHSMKFSKFVALNLPDFYNKDIDESKNGIYLHALVEDTSSSEIDKDELNTRLKKYLQNYILNLETLILNKEYNNNKSYSEALFFKWLQEVGAIEFVEDGNYLIEKQKEGSNKVITYIGDIDIANTVDINGDTYSEIYLHIPSNHGQLSYNDIKFKQFDELKNFQISGENEYIVGREEKEEYKAIYDNNEENYYEIKQNQNIGISFEDINNNELANNSTYNFEFNTVLIYYDLYNQNNEKIATNLYGILFLEEVSDASSTNTDDAAGYIQRYPKYVETGIMNGNSFGLKVNIKIDVNPESKLVSESILSTNATHSMELFADAMTELQKSSAMFMTVQNELNELQKKTETVSNIVSQMPDWNIMKEQIEDLNVLFSKLSNLYSDLDERVKKLEEE